MHAANRLSPTRLPRAYRTRHRLLCDAGFLQVEVFTLTWGFAKREKYVSKGTVAPMITVWVRGPGKGAWTLAPRYQLFPPGRIST